MKLQTHHWSFTGLLLLVSMIVGALAGVISSIMTYRSLDEYMEKMSGQEVLLSLSQVKPEPVPGTYEEALLSVYDSYRYLAYLFPSTEVSADADDWVYPDDAMATGVVVTSDGWILFEADAVVGVGVQTGTVFANNTWFEIDNIVHDIRENMVLIHINANNLSAVTFGFSPSAQVGDMVFVPSHDTHMTVTSLERIGSDQHASYRAEDGSDVWTLQDDVHPGVPVFDSSGRLVAITQDQQEAIPSYQLETFVTSVLEHGEPTYAAMGCYVMDIASALNVDVAALGSDYGFMITGAHIRQGVVRNGPAAKAGLQEGDILMAVDGATVSSADPLSDVLSRYDVGDEILIDYLREGEQSTVPVTLGDYDLLY